MLTAEELQSVREKLRQAQALIEEAKIAFLSDRTRFASARLLSDLGHFVSDEIAALDKEIAAKP